MEDANIKNIDSVTRSREMVLKEVGEESRRAKRTQVSPAAPVAAVQKTEDPIAAVSPGQDNRIDLLKAMSDITAPEIKNERPGKAPEAVIAPQSVKKVRSAGAETVKRPIRPDRQETIKRDIGRRKTGSGRISRLSRGARLAGEKPVAIRIVSDSDGDAFVQGSRLGLKILAFGFLFFIFSYLSVSLSVLMFHIDLPLTRRISRAIPIPAVISSFGVLDYYDYADFVLKRGSGSSAEILEDAARSLVEKSLARQYGLAKADLPAEEIKRILNKKILEDKSVNYPALVRVEKIMALSKTQDFIAVAKQYGKDFEQATMTEREAVEKFGHDITRLGVGQVSGIMPAADGLHIVKMIDKNDSGLTIMSAFAGGAGLGALIDRKLAEGRMWLLTDI